MIRLDTCYIWVNRLCCSKKYVHSWGKTCQHNLLYFVHPLDLPCLVLKTKISHYKYILPQGRLRGVVARAHVPCTRTRRRPAKISAADVSVAALTYEVAVKYQKGCKCCLDCAGASSRSCRATRDPSLTGLVFFRARDARFIANRKHRQDASTVHAKLKVCSQRGARARLPRRSQCRES